MSFERRKIRVGKVVGDKMDKTVVVSLEWRTSHPLYGKAIRRRTRFKAHDSGNECRTGDLVRLIEIRPMSKTKRWRVAEILTREDIAEVQPDEIAVDESVMTARASTAEAEAAVAVAIETEDEQAAEPEKETAAVAEVAEAEEPVKEEEAEEEQGAETPPTEEPSEADDEQSAEDKASGP